MALFSLFFPSSSRCGSKQAEEDYRPLFENFVQDLLSTVNKPEWPAAELLLSLLGRLLVSMTERFLWTGNAAVCAKVISGIEDPDWEQRTYLPSFDKKETFQHWDLDLGGCNSLCVNNWLFYVNIIIIYLYIFFSLVYYVRKHLK